VDARVPLEGLKHFMVRPMPTWGADLSHLDLDNIVYYVKPTELEGKSWDDVPDSIKKTFDRLGIPEAEQKFLAGVGAQYESEMVYHNIQEHLEKQGVIFLSIEEGLRQYPDLFAQYFGKVIPIEDNKFAALNSAVWSGGSFVYIPPGVKVDLPLQAYFRLNMANIGQFERSIIIADEGAQVHYVEGCTAPSYTTDSFHSGVIEIVVKKNARVRYTTIQNWSTNVYNLVTQRALVEEGGTMEWVDCNLGSKVIHEVPFLLPGRSRRAWRDSFDGVRRPGQWQVAGGKILHLLPIPAAKSLRSRSARAAGAPRTGAAQSPQGCEQCSVQCVCDALLLDPNRAQIPTRPSKSTKKMFRLATKPGLQGWRRTALLPDEPRPEL